VSAGELRLGLSYRLWRKGYLYIHLRPLADLCAYHAGVAVFMSLSSPSVGHKCPAPSPARKFAILMLLRNSASAFQFLHTYLRDGLGSSLALRDSFSLRTNPSGIHSRIKKGCWLRAKKGKKWENKRGSCEQTASSRLQSLEFHKKSLRAYRSFKMSACPVGARMSFALRHFPTDIMQLWAAATRTAAI